MPFIGLTLDLGSISPMFYAQLLRQQSCASKVQTLKLSTKKLWAQLTYVKAVRRWLVKLTPVWLKNPRLYSKLKFVSRSNKIFDQKNPQIATNFFNFWSNAIWSLAFKFNSCPKKSAWRSWGTCVTSWKEKP